jgi:hypothetical protein
MCSTRAVISHLLPVYFTQNAKVKVTRWFPGVLQAIIEEVNSKSSVSKTTTAVSPKSVKEVLAKEATKTLENKRNMQIAATKEKSLDEIKKEMGIPLESTPAAKEAQAPAVVDLGTPGAPTPPTTTRRRVRQKMRSTPVTGGSLFDDPSTPEPKATASGENRQPFMGNIGQAAELVVNGEVFKIRVMPETVQRIRSGYSGDLLDDASVKFSQKDVPLEHRLQGFIRTSNLGLRTISEDVSETASEQNGSEQGAELGGGW